MKALFRACLVALPFFALPAFAQAWRVPPIKIDTGAKAWFNCYVGDACVKAQLGPWYTYFPYNAQFQSPAPMGYPYWPTAPMGNPGKGDPGKGGTGATQALYYPGSAIQPISYQSLAPSYWYGK